MRLFSVLVTSLVLLACSGAETQAVEAPAEATGDISNAWVVDRSASSVGFTGSQQGKTFEGTFGSFDAVIVLDPDDLGAASIRATIDMESVDAGNGERNSSLPGKDWFHVREHPEAVFVSDAISRTGDNNYEAAGTLTLKGISQNVILPFSLEITDGVAEAEGELTLIRTDYKVGDGAFATGEWIALEVDVTVTIRAIRP